MKPRNISAFFAIAIVSIEAFQIRKAAKVEEVEINHNWENEQDLDFRAVVCSECSQNLKPPTQCLSCSQDNDCRSDQVCCPFLTLTTSPSACTNEHNKNCRLSNTIIVDFLRSVCSCVRQVKCCAKATATVTTTTTTMVTQQTTEEQSTSNEMATSKATEPSTEESTMYSTEESTMYSTEESTMYSTEESTMYSTEESTMYPTEESTMYPTEESTMYSTEEWTAPSWDSASETTSVAAYY